MISRIMWITELLLKVGLGIVSILTLVLVSVGMVQMLVYMLTVGPNWMVK